MKIFNTYDFVSERMKFKPVTNIEWDKIQQDINKNPFGLTEEDLTGDIKHFPMGVVVRMLEEQKNQGNTSDVKVFQKNNATSKKRKGFSWDLAKNGWAFWHDVIENGNFSLFFEKYPEYEKYNIY